MDLIRITRGILSLQISSSPVILRCYHRNHNHSGRVTSLITFCGFGTLVRPIREDKLRQIVVNGKCSQNWENSSRSPGIGKFDYTLAQGLLLGKVFNFARD